MRQLARTWIEAEREYYQLSPARAIRRLNKELATRFTHSRVSEWKRGKHQPSSLVLSVLLYRSLPWILETAGVSVSDGQLARVDDALWLRVRRRGKTVHVMR